MSEIFIQARAPFDFAATARFLRATEAEAVDTFRAGCYARAFHFNEQLYLVRVEQQRAVLTDTTDTTEEARPTLALKVSPSPPPASPVWQEAAHLVRHIFTTGHDLTGWRERAARDALMQQLEAAHRGLHLACWPTLFEALVVSILSQQISTAVAMTFKRRFVERFGATLSQQGHTYFAFPRPETVARAAVEDLRALGLSGAKATSIRELARAVCEGQLDADTLEHQDNETIIARLTELRGVGRWTAEWTLMLYFGRTDIFPAGDLFLRGALIKYYKRGTLLNEKELRALAARRWGPWSAYAALYLIAGLRAGSVTLK